MKHTKIAMIFLIQILFFLSSCSKEKLSVSNVNTLPPPSPSPWPLPSSSKEIINTNLKWDANYTTKIATARMAVLLPAPSLYSVDSIREVYTFVNNGYTNIGRTIDLTGNKVYYKIENNSVILCKNNIAFVYDLPVGLLFITKTAKVTFR